MKLPVLQNAFPLSTDKAESKDFLNRVAGGNPYNAAVERLIVEGKIKPAPYTLPLPYLSVSQVEMYLRCPMQYKFRYIDGKKKAPGIGMVQGTAVHKVVEDSYKWMAEHKQVSPLEMAMDTYSDAITRGVTEDVQFSDDITSIEQAKAQGEGLIKIWHKEKAPKVKPVAVEESFVTMFGDIPIVGAIDLIDRVNTPLSPDQRWENKTDGTTDPMLDVIVDNKVVGKKHAQGDVDGSLQMTLYSHATGITNQRYDFYIKTKVPKIEQMLTSRKAADVKWAIRVFENVAKAISAGIFPECSPTSWGCSPRWCGYWNECRGAVK